MALTLAEAAKLTQNPIERGVMETFAIESPVLERLPLRPIQGNAYSYASEGTLPGVEFRAVNSAYAESTGTVNQATEKIVILGGDADVDTFLVRTGGNLADLRATQTAMKTKAIAYKFQDAFFNGDVAVDANGFDGLRKRLSGSQVIVPAVNGIPVLGASDDDRHAFFDALDAAIAAVPGANAIYAPAPLVAKIRSSARRLTMYDQARDTFGRTIDAYNGIPILSAGNRPDGTPILPVNETEGASTDTGSIYVVRFGRDVNDAGVTGLTNGGVSVRDLGEIDVKPVYRTRVELFAGLAVFGGKAAARLAGIRNL